MKNDILFSHRPKAGISIGVLSDNGRLFIALALTNDGWSRNQHFHKDRQDSFSRSRSRSIIEGRINTLKEQGTNGQFQFEFATDMTSGEFLRAFREWFKPTHEETDTTFALIDQDSGQVLLERLGGSDIADRMYTKAVEVVQSYDGAQL